MTEIVAKKVFLPTDMVIALRWAMIEGRLDSFLRCDSNGSVRETGRDMQKFKDVQWPICDARGQRNVYRFFLSWSMIAMRGVSVIIGQKLLQMTEHCISAACEGKSGI
jgi:hypothetical protein